MRFAPYSLVPIALVLAGCGFFTLDEPEEKEKMGTGGTGGSGTGGASGGTGGATGGTGGAMGGTAGTIVMAGTGGGAGDSSSGGSAGAVAGSGGDTTTGGSAGSGGNAGGAGAGGATGGSAGEGAGAGGTAGGGGSGGSGLTGCAAINPQAQAFGGHCYYRNTTAVTWNAAKSGCEALSPGGHLVTITSMEEQQFVWGLASMMDAWIGATDGLMDNQGGNGTPSSWITGEDIAQFNGWASGEPNNYQKDCPGGGMCWEHCGFMWVDTQGAWNDDICGYEKAYICEWDSGG